MHVHSRRHFAAAALVVISVTLLTLCPRGRAFAEPPGTDNSRYGLAAPPTFHTSLRIPAARNGLRGDGRTDNTSAFRALLGTGNRQIRIAAGTYVTGKLVIPKNTVLILDRGVVIKDSGKLGPGDRLINIFDGNVYIHSNGARVVSDRRYYNGGEQRHGIFIYGASNVFIDGVESSDNSGDGFYIGGPSADRPAQNITLKNCDATGNRRQGLSITSARNVSVIDCTFSHTQGTPPAYGVDLEPNAASNFLEGIRLIRIHTNANHGGGILLQLGMLNGSSTPIDIEISHHVSVGEGHAYTVIRPKGVRGKLTREP